MTLKEAKKLLTKEFVEINFHKSTEPFEFDESRWFVGEKPEVLDAFRVLSKEGYYITISGHDYDMRKARLGRPTDKPSSDTPSTLNPALKEAASQFNDALLDEQAKKIAELTKDKTNLEDQITILNACKEHNENFAKREIKRLGKEIARLNKVINKKNLKIEELKKERSEHLAGEVKFFGETVDLSQELCDKNEELRLSKIREENLTEVCQKYLKEIEELREKLADKVVDKIDAQALKSAESALAWKEKVVTYKDMALAYYEKKLAEKDEVISNLGKELKAQKDLVDDISLKYDGAKHNLKLRMDECEKLKNELEEKTKLVEIVRNASKEYCDYGVAANEFIKKLANLYVIASNKGTISNEMFERCKNYQTYGFPATCNKETQKEIDDIARGKENNKPRISTPEISEEELMKIQEKVAASFDIAEEGGDHSGAVVLCGKDFVKKFKENVESVFDFFKSRAKEADEFMFIESGHLGGNGLIDQMEDNNHPTEDNPEEVDVDEVLERVRKALEEGHTVSIDYKD